MLVAVLVEKIPKQQEDFLIINISVSHKKQYLVICEN